MTSHYAVSVDDGSADPVSERFATDYAIDFAAKLSRFVKGAALVHQVPTGWDGMDWEATVVAAFRDGVSVGLAEWS
jgi:hypothetical protein